MGEQSVETQLALIAQSVNTFRAETVARLDSIDARFATLNGSVAKQKEWQYGHDLAHAQAVGAITEQKRQEEQQAQRVSLPRWFFLGLLAGMFTLAAGAVGSLIRVFLG